jgi:hypothetical protein
VRRGRCPSAPTTRHGRWQRQARRHHREVSAGANCKLEAPIIEITGTISITLKVGQSWIKTDAEAVWGRGCTDRVGLTRRRRGRLSGEPHTSRRSADVSRRLASIRRASTSPSTGESRGFAWDRSEAFAGGRAFCPIKSRLLQTSRSAPSAGSCNGRGIG